MARLKAAERDLILKQVMKALKEKFDSPLTTEENDRVVNSILETDTEYVERFIAVERAIEALEEAEKNLSKASDHLLKLLKEKWEGRDIIYPWNNKYEKSSLKKIEEKAKQNRVYELGIRHNINFRRLKEDVEDFLIIKSFPASKDLTELIDQTIEKYTDIIEKYMV